jgi:hypothetical protein
MGAQRQRYIPTSPLEVHICKRRKQNGNNNNENGNDSDSNREDSNGSSSSNWLEWTIPITVELESQCKWPLSPSSSSPPPALAAGTPSTTLALSSSSSDHDDSHQNRLVAAEEKEKDSTEIVQRNAANTDEDDASASALLTQSKSENSNDMSPTLSSLSSSTSTLLSASSAESITESTEYKWIGPRRVAVMAHAGMGPQDDNISKLRQELYTQVVERDGHRPKLDTDTGRPIFLYWQNAFKGCYTTEQGLGMAVYEWRPQWTKPGCVGIELEMDD